MASPRETKSIHAVTARGLSRRRQTGIGAACAAAVLLAGLAGMAGRSWPWFAAVVALSAGWAAWQVFWLRRLVDGYVSKIEKSTLTARRFQNISKYFESILQDSTDIIFSVDPEGFILKFNNGAEMHFGYSQEEIVGKPLHILFVNEGDERNIISAVLLNGKSINEEVSMKTKDGRIILLNMSMSEMKSNNGQIIGIVATAKDITEKKKLEEALKK